MRSHHKKVRSASGNISNSFNMDRCKPNSSATGYVASPVGLIGRTPSFAATWQAPHSFTKSSMSMPINAILMRSPAGRAASAAKAALSASIPIVRPAAEDLKLRSRRPRIKATRHRVRIRTRQIKPSSLLVGTPTRHVPTVTVNPNPEQFPSKKASRTNYMIGQSQQALGAAIDRVAKFNDPSMDPDEQSRQKLDAIRRINPNLAGTVES